MSRLHRSDRTGPLDRPDLPGQPVPVVLDCDPGHDDALAILLAAGDPRIDLRAITTVAGNQTVDLTTRNALRVCTLAGITDVPIAAGCDGPLHGDLVTAAGVHGASGLDGATFGEPTVDVDERHAVDLLHTVLQASDRPVTVVGVGPLTNLATLLRRFPDDRERIACFEIMGGSTARGNVTPYAEFNTFVDPHAARIVLDSGVPTVWHGLQVTRQATADQDVLDRIASLGSELAAVCVQLLTFYRGSYRRRSGRDAPPVHDPVAIAHVLDPALVSTREVGLRIEVEGVHTAGATVADLEGVMDWTPDAVVGLQLDRDRFWEVLIGAIERLGSTGPDHDIPTSGG